MIRFNLNGRDVSYTGDENRSLLSVLRDNFKILTVKDGCSGEGVCGACLVEIEGKPALACKTLISRVKNSQIITINGFPETVKKVLAKAFVSEAAVQCGYCSPGMLTRAAILLKNSLNPTRETVFKALKPHLCRCTGYIKIVDAIMLAAAVLRGEKDILFQQPFVGFSPPKYKGYEKALGIETFIDDTYVEKMLYGALLFTEHPRAKILKIDVSQALVVKGVVKILTSKDIPGNRKVGMIIRDWPLYIDEGECTNYTGDVLLCVVAENEDIARFAISKIKVDYEVLRPITDVMEAILGKERIHQGGNILKKTSICYGEGISTVFKKSSFVAEAIITTPLVEHAYMEVEASVAMPDDDGVVVYSQGQGIFEDRSQIAEALGIEKSKVKVRLVPSGGAFGGKEDLTVQCHSALAAHLLKRPVKVKLNRKESIRMSTKKHPMIMEYKLGCDKNGKFTGLYARIVGDTGAYASVGGAVMDRAATHAGGAYYIPNIDVEAVAVYTNNIPAGAMRGFGVNQVTFAIETMIDELCKMGKFDRWQIRYDNALDVGLTTTSGHRLKKAVGLKKTLEMVKEEYRAEKYTGIACAIKNCGIGNGLLEKSEVLVKILAHDKFKIYHGWSEMGQGIDTVAIQMFREQLHLKYNITIDVISTTELETIGGSTTASRGTYLLGKALIDAVNKINKDLENANIKDIVGKQYRGFYVCDWTTTPDFNGEMVSHFAYSFATHLVVLDKAGNIKKVIGAHDSGKVVNKKLFEGQIQGGIVMGLGYAMTEKLVLKDGVPVNNSLGKLGLLRSTDVPIDIEVFTVETEDVDAPYGAKGVGEISSIPTAAAVGGAFRQYYGQHFYNLPLSISKLQK